LKFEAQHVALLVLELQRAELVVAPDQILTVHDLLAYLRISGSEPEGLPAYRALLAPVFCRNHEQQELFYRVYRRWASALSEGDREPAPVDLTPSDKPEIVASETPQPRARTWKIVVGSAILLVVLVLALLAIQPVFTPEVPTQPEPVVVAPRPLPGDITGVIPTTFLSTVEPLPRPPERVAGRLHIRRLALDADHLRTSFALLPPLVLLALLIWRFARRQLVLTRAASDEPPQPHYLQVRGTREDLFATHRLRPTIDRLRAAVRVPVRNIDARRTVETTLRNAGLFVPVYRMRRVLPEYVVLIDQLRADDQLATYGRALFERLRSEGITVFVYYYDRDPRRCYAENQPKQWIGLDQLEARHGHARLVLISDGAGLFSPLSGRLQRWTRQLARWPIRMLLTPNPPRRWDRRELAMALAGISIAPLDASGLEATARWIVAGVGEMQVHEQSAPLLHGDDATLPLPSVIAERFEELLEDELPAGMKIEDLLTPLERFLGPQGYLVLQALAIYPQLKWPLTLYIDWRLAPAGEPEAQRERRIFDLARLPWFRHGRMPDSLRMRLIRSLPTPREREIRELYRALLDSALEQGEKSVELTIDSAPSADSWKRIRRLFGRTDPAGIYADRIFAKTLLVGRSGLLDIVLERKLEQVLPARGRLRFAVLALALAVSTAAASAAVYFGSEVMQSQIERRLFVGEKERNTGRLVVIGYEPERRALARSLAAVLHDWGFRVQYADRQEHDNYMRGDEVVPITPVSSHTVAYMTEADAAVGDWIAKRLQYLSYEVAPELAGPARASWTAEREKLTFGGSAAEMPAVLVTLINRWRPGLIEEYPPQYARTGTPEIFQDRLAKGELGPQLVWIPAGSIVARGEYAPQTRSGEVTLANPLGVGRYEITVGEFRRFVAATGYSPASSTGLCLIEGMTRDGKTLTVPVFIGEPKGDDYPEVCVSVNGANAYARWLSEQTGQRYRLPTFEEWAYVQTAGAAEGPAIADDSRCSYANYCGSSTRPVGQFSPNGFELYDMLGNAGELVDCPNDTVCRALGGSWSGQQSYVMGNPDEVRDTVGFRVVREIDDGSR
jgi:formylglycine-generating enzyme required for sulfatase activity